MNAKYAEVASRMRDYETQHYFHWKAETEKALPLLLKKSVLLMVNSAGVVCADFTKPDTVCYLQYSTVKLKFIKYLNETKS